MGLILMDFGCGSFKRVAYFEKFDAEWPPETRRRNLVICGGLGSICVIVSKTRISVG